MPQKEEQIHNYLQFIRKYGFIICLSTLIVLGIALIFSLRIPKTYSAAILMRLIQPNPSSSLSSNNLFQTVFSGGVDRRQMSTISERFATESMLTTALEYLEENQIGKLQILPGIANLKQKLQAQIHPDADYIQLSIKLTETEGGERNAALLVNQLARNMQILRSKQEKTRLTKLQKFLQQKQNEYEKETKYIIDDTLNFVKQNGSPEIWYPKLTNLLERHRNLQQQIGIAKHALYTAQRRLTHLKNQKKDLPQQTQISKTQNYNPIWLEQRKKLLELEAQQIADAKKAGTSSHELSGLAAQIEEIQKQADRTPQMTTWTTHGTSAHYTYIENQLIELPPMIEGYKNETQQLNQELKRTQNQIQEMLDEIPENQLMLTQLRAKVQLAATLNEEIAKRYLETEILNIEADIDEEQIGGIEIVDIAVPRKIPVSPQFKLIAVLAAVVGLCLGVTIALLMEYFKNTSNSYRN